MLSSNQQLWYSDKSCLWQGYASEPGISVVQIVGSVSGEMAQPASISVKNGAQIIDINMECPAKKVNRQQAGSALLCESVRVQDSLSTVVNAVDVPVTIKNSYRLEPK